MGDFDPVAVWVGDKADPCRLAEGHGRAAFATAAIEDALVLCVDLPDLDRDLAVALAAHLLRGRLVRVFFEQENRGAPAKTLVVQLFDLQDVVVEVAECSQ